MLYFYFICLIIINGFDNIYNIKVENMKKFLNISKKPLVIATIAVVLCVIDALIGGLFVKGGSFMWVAFAFWTVFFGATINERIRGFIGAVIGFGAALLMMWISSSFSLSIYTISISTVLGVFLVNCLVMYLEKTEKFWTNSISGIFVGIMLTFSGLGQKLSPLSSFKEGAITLGIILTYGLLGMLCGYFSILFTSKKKEEKRIEENKQDK